MTQIKFITTDYGSQLETETNRWIAAMSKKYKDEFEWGGVFLMNPDKKYLTDAEYAEMIEKIKSNIK